MRCHVTVEEKGNAPLGRRCNSKNVVYQHAFPPMEYNDGERVYIGISAGNWKQRLYNILSPICNLETKPLYLNIFGTLRTAQIKWKIGSLQPRIASMADVTRVSMKKLV